MTYKLPDEFYVGYRQGATNPLAFMTPNGSDAAAQKRKNTVDNWQSYNETRYNWVDGKQISYVDNTDCRKQEVISNVAQKGFMLIDRLNRGGSYYGNQDKWRVIDPRGFTIEINGDNLLSIIEDCTIVKGEVQEELIYIRDGAYNRLVTLNSEAYKEASAVPINLKPEFVSLTKLKVGDKVIIPTGEMIYQGKFYTLDNKYKVSDKSSWVFECKGYLYVYASAPKIQSIISSNNEVWDLQRLDGLARYQSTKSIVALLPDKNLELSYSFRETQRIDSYNLWVPYMSMWLRTPYAKQDNTYITSKHKAGVLPESTWSHWRDKLDIGSTFYKEVLTFEYNGDTITKELETY